jgi:LysR family transcriptional regulator (chromosome initiation inhibitor)
MLDYRLLEALALVCQEGGFDRAARALLITQSAVSQRIRQLEDRLGFPLVIRSAPPTPTAMGRVLVAHYRRVCQLEKDLEGALPTLGQEGFLSLPIGVNEDSMATWFTQAISGLARDRNFTLHISVDDQDETHKLLKHGEVLGCVSSRAEPLQGCAVNYLGRIDYLCLATPAFIERWLAEGWTGEVIRRAPAVVYSPKDRCHQRFVEEVLGIPDTPFPHHFIPSSHGFLAAIANSLGYGLAPHMQAAQLLDARQAVEGSPGLTMPVHLYWHHWDLRAGPIQELTTALVHHSRRLLPQHDRPRR